MSPRRREADVTTRNLTIPDALRPLTLAEFSGQPALAERLRIILSSAATRDQLPDHLLFAGPPGLGKTTLAHIIANELGVHEVTTSGPALERPGDIVGLFTSLVGPSVVFIDEIHGLRRSLEELLYPAMEDGVMDVSYGEGPQARTIRLPIQPFVLIGATTQAGQVSSPLRDRFGYVGRLKPYETDALAAIVRRSAALLDLEIDDDAAHQVALRARGTPRLANAWLRRVRDFAQSHGHTGPVGAEQAIAALEAFGIDGLGLDDLGREILTTLVDTFRGGPVGLTTLAATVNESPVTLEEVYEPHLMHQGLLARTPRGRVATVHTYLHLGRPVPAGLTETESTPTLDEALKAADAAS